MRPNIEKIFILIVIPKVTLKILRFMGKGPAPIEKLFASNSGMYGCKISPIKLPIMAQIKSNRNKNPTLLEAFPTIDFSPLDNNYSFIFKKLT